MLSRPMASLALSYPCQTSQQLAAHPPRPNPTQTHKHIHTHALFLSVFVILPPVLPPPSLLDIFGFQWLDSVICVHTVCETVRACVIMHVWTRMRMAEGLEPQSAH